MRIRIPARSYFDRTHKWKGSMDMGLLYPVCCEEIYPGDTFRDRTEILLRFEAMIKPMMHEVNVYTHWFFVRDWTIMEDFEDMIFAGPDGESTVEVPFNEEQVTIEQGELGDCLNINPGVYDADYFSMLPFRGYNKIYNDWYRPQFLEDEIDLDSMVLQRRCWERDFFTGGQPWPQLGPQVLLPIGQSAPVLADLDNTQGGAFLPYYNTTTGGVGLGNYNRTGSSDAAHIADASAQGNKTSLYTDLSAGTGVPYDVWRISTQLQHWQFMNGLGGTRYVEGVKTHFGVNTPDGRVERAEYLGGGKSSVVVSEVLQTAESSESGTPQGNLAGHGISAQITNGFKRTFTEHGYLYCILSVMPRSSYSQGIDPMFFRKNHLDFMTPEFAHLGYRPIPMKYLYTGAYMKDGEVVDPSTTGAVWTPTADPDATFNYHAIYDELRYKPSTVHGTFRGKESYWTLTRIFGETPAFNLDFVKCNPSKRIFAVQNEPGLKIEILHHLDAFRELPKEGIPWHF